ncbi:MAG: hypothetical protein B7Z81_07270, partial [Acidocella sp. 20-61-6]
RILLRAGRIDEAIVRLNEGTAVVKEKEMPTDWAYLALAHARTGRYRDAWHALVQGQGGAVLLLGASWPV